MDGKVRAAVPPFGGGGAGFLSNTMWPRPIEAYLHIPSGILIHPTVWLEYTNVTDKRQDRQRSNSMGQTVFGRPLVKRFVLCYRTVVCLSCLSCPVCNVGVCGQNSWMDQYETWRGGRTRPMPHCVRWSSSPPPTERGTADPSFSARCAGVVFSATLLTTYNLPSCACCTDAGLPASVNRGHVYCGETVADLS